MNEPSCKRIVPVVAVGTPPTDYKYNAWECAEVHFHGFGRLPCLTNYPVSTEFTCLGRHWLLHLYPGGDVESDPENVALIFVHRSDGPIVLDYSFSVRNSHGRQIAYWKERAYFSNAPGVEESWGQKNFAELEDIMEGLIDGALVVEVQMRKIELTGTNVPPSQFIPENPLCKNVLKRFMDEESADVLIEVGSGSTLGEGTNKKSKTTLATFYAHHFILQDCAPALAELAKSAKNMTSIRITDAKPDIFRHMLYYVYGGKLTEEELNANAKDIIDIADKFGVVNLKLEAEVCYARSIELTVDNVIDNLLYAGAKNCALLTEVVMDFVVANDKAILEKVSFENVPGSMMTDLLTAVTRGNVASDGSDDDDGYGTMRVSELRKKLHEKGLDIDGSRKSMIALLRENSSTSVQDPV